VSGLWSRWLFSDFALFFFLFLTVFNVKMSNVMLTAKIVFSIHSLLTLFDCTKHPLIDDGAGDLESIPWRRHIDCPFVQCPNAKM